VDRPDVPRSDIVLGEPFRLVPGMPALVGVTSGDFVIYRDTGLFAVRMEPGAEPMAISDQGGVTFIRGSVVFAWANVDWETNLGDLTLWTAASGATHVGTAMSQEATVAASADGSHVMYATNVTPTTMDLVLASADLSSQVTIVPSAGRGSQTTCAPHYVFANGHAFVGWCAEGSLEAKIERFDTAQSELGGTEIATGTQPRFSVDAQGKRLVYITRSSILRSFEDGTARDVDRNVAWAMIVPDGSAIFYKVGDQLRRSNLPDIEPTPVVTAGFVQQAEWSPRHELVLYSTQVKYEAGTRRDLLLTTTDAYNPTPQSLVAEPMATIPRSAFTSDVGFIIYLTDVTPERRATLHLRPVAGGDEVVLTNVDDAAPAGGSAIVFTDNRSDPDRYPVTARLQVLDLASGAEPMLIEERSFDGRSFFVNQSADKVVYVRIAEDDPDSRGLYVRSIR
jgi:hypothetical protein